MKIVDDFDEHHRKLYVIQLALLALASILMWVAAALSPDENSYSRGDFAAYALLSTTTAVVCCVLLGRFKRSFFLVGLSNLVFSLALYRFGAPLAAVLILGVPSALVGIGSLLLGGLANSRDARS